MNSPSSSQEATESIRSTRSNRTTLSLTDASLLRGCTPAVLLEGCGRRFRSSSGDAPDYDSSFAVEQLDTFFSHSWHAYWLWKYAALLVWFNGLGAVLFSLCFSALILCVWQLPWERARDNEFFLAIEARIPPPPPSCSFDYLSHRMLAGVLCQLLLPIALLLWHRLKLPWLCPRRSVFLDKVCIHQTDQDKKKDGIESIGAFLANSKSMLLVWDSTYFSRLWCVYELSAFKMAKPEAPIYFVPVHLGLFMMILSASLWLFSLHVLLSRGIQLCFISTGFGARNHLLSEALMTVIFVFSRLPLVLCYYVAHRYIQEFSELLVKLDHLTAEQASCFCCTCNHVEPNSGEPIMCDREIVYNSIATWYGDGDRSLGLKRFNQKIRSSLKNDIAKTLGVVAPFPYLAVVCLSAPLALLLMQDVMLLLRKNDYGNQKLCCLGRIVEACFLRLHCKIVILFCAGRFCNERRTSGAMTKYMHHFALVCFLLLLFEFETTCVDQANYSSLGRLFASGFSVSVPIMNYPTLVERVCFRVVGNWSVADDFFQVKVAGPWECGICYHLLLDCLAIDIMALIVEISIVVGAYLVPLMQSPRKIREEPHREEVGIEMESFFEGVQH